MKLITEQIEEIKVLTEGKGDSKKLYIEGVFLQSNIRNRNGRIYEYRILDREVKRYNEQYVKTGRALGELGHPDGPTVNLDRVSHKIVSLTPDGDNFIGKAQILESTPMGKIAKSLLDEGVKLGVSSRGVGSLVERSGTKYVADDFMLATAADIVADPSAPDAFVQGIMEGKEWVWQNGILAEKSYNQIRNLPSSVDKKVRESRILEAFESYLSNI